MAISIDADLLKIAEIEKSKRSAEASFYDFVKQSWEVVEPGVKYVDSWHIRVLCDHLEAVTKGEIQNIFISLCKTVLIMR